MATWPIKLINFSRSICTTTSFKVPTKKNRWKYFWNLILPSKRFASSDDVFKGVSQCVFQFNSTCQMFGKFLNGSDVVARWCCAKESNLILKNFANIFNNINIKLTLSFFLGSMWHLCNMLWGHYKEFLNFWKLNTLCSQRMMFAIDVINP